MHDSASAVALREFKSTSPARHDSDGTAFGCWGLAAGAPRVPQQDPEHAALPALA